MTAEHKPLSPGERSVWAVVYGERWAAEMTADTIYSEAVQRSVEDACDAVMALRSVGPGMDVDVDKRAMLEDMLGHPGELVCPDGRTAAFTAIPDSCVLCGRTSSNHRSRH